MQLCSLIIHTMFCSLSKLCIRYLVSIQHTINGWIFHSFNNMITILFWSIFESHLVNIGCNKHIKITNESKSYRCSLIEYIKQKRFKEMMWEKKKMDKVIEEAKLKKNWHLSCRFFKTMTYSIRIRSHKTLRACPSTSLRGKIEEKEVEVAPMGASRPVPHEEAHLLPLVLLFF